MPRVLVVATVLLLAATSQGGCDIGPIRRIGPAPTPPASPLVTAPAPVFAVERSVLPVGPGMSVFSVEFADRYTGYALAVGCGPEYTPSGGPAQTENMECTGALATTADGGRTWIPLPHPHPVGGNHQMYTLDSHTVAVFTEDSGYHLSVDGGHHFAKVTEPIPSSRVGLFCEPPPCGVFEFTPIGPARRLPAQPDLPGDVTAVTEGAEGQLWVASVAKGKPYTALSLDRGQSWHRHDVLWPSGDQVIRVGVQMSADGADAWLLGYRLGEPTEFPDFIWYYEPGGWALRNAGTHPQNGVVTPAGGQVLVAAGPSGMAVLDSGVGNGIYQKRPEWPSARDYVIQLGDGTLVARSGDRLWLGPGEGAHRGWIEIIVTTP